MLRHIKKYKEEIANEQIIHRPHYWKPSDGKNDIWKFILSLLGELENIYILNFNLFFIYLFLYKFSFFLPFLQYLVQFTRWYWHLIFSTIQRIEIWCRWVLRLKKNECSCSLKNRLCLKSWGKKRIRKPKNPPILGKKWGGGGGACCSMEYGDRVLHHVCSHLYYHTLWLFGRERKGN